MEQRAEAEFQDVDFTSMSVLLSVVAASFVTLGVIIFSSAKIRRPQWPPPTTIRPR